MRAGSSWRALVRALLTSGWLTLQRFAAFGPGSSHAFAVPQDGLLRAETDNRHLRRLVGLLLLTVIFILHENKALHRTTKCLVKCSAPAAACARSRVIQHGE